MLDSPIKKKKKKKEKKKKRDDAMPSFEPEIPAIKS
jgi:hypothetical protein